MATISNTPRPGYVWDSADNVWYPIGVGAHQHTNAADTPAVMPYSNDIAAGKNVLINSDFKINQRSTGLTTTSTTFVVDRFSINYSGGTCSGEQKTFSPGAGITDIASVENYLEYISSGQSGTSDFMRCRSVFEDVYTFAGQTVTFSFYAKAASGTPKIALGLTQNFGSGGSTAVTTKMGESTLSTSWARYSITFTMPSISGKTIGASNYNTIQFFMSAGTAVDSGIWGIGVQNNTFQFTAFQLELGSNMTAFQTATGNPQAELAACQRYYIRLNSGNTGIASTFGMGYAGSATVAQIFVPLPVTMRRKGNDYLTLDYSGVRMQDYNTSYTVTAVAIPNYQNGGNGQVLLVTSSGMTAYRPMEFDTTSGGYIGFGAEL
jgi:hypothetical protein